MRINETICLFVSDTEHRQMPISLLSLDHTPIPKAWPEFRDKTVPTNTDTAIG